MTKLARESGTFLPTFEQHHLLRAALLRDAAQVRESFDTWKSRVALDAIDSGSLRLLPLLYRNLKRLGIDDAMMPRLKGVYRQTWFRNQLILEHGAIALRALDAAGITAIKLKGAALVPIAYDEPALRPMEDFDLLVAREDFSRAVDVLRREGWSFQPALADPEPHFVFQHAVGFRREGGGELDLHWSAMGLPRGITKLSNADLLLQVCAHATLLNPYTPPIRWAGDAFLLLSRGEFAWDDLVESARVRGWSLVMRHCLTYLRDGLGVAVPDGVIATLKRQGRLRERIALAVRNGRGRMVYVQFLVEWLQHGLVEPRRLVLLPRFLRSYCRVTSTATLVRLVTSRLALGTPLIRPLATFSPQRGEKATPVHAAQD